MNKKLECIKRLIDNDRFFEFTDWLVEHRLVKKDDFIGLTRNKEKAEFIYNIFEQGMNNEMLQLVDYEWSLLPLELIKITCVTELEKKVFTYGY